MSNNTETNVQTRKSTLFDKFLNGMEKAGNMLPDPVMIFIILCFIIMIISVICEKAGVSAVNPGTGRTVLAESLLTKNNLRDILTSMVRVFQQYPPLGVVLVSMIGIGVADKSGFLETLLIIVVKKVPKSLIYFAVILMGLIFTGIGDAGFIVLPPLAAIMFLNLGKSPIVGMLLAFAGAGVGFCSGLFVSLNDILVSSFTIPAAQLIDSTFDKSPAMTLYFNMINSFIQMFIIYWVTVKFIEPRFPVSKESLNEHEEGRIITLNDSKGVKMAGVAFVIYMALIAFLALGKDAFLRDEAGSLVSTKSPLMGGLIPLMSLAFLIPGYVYGKITGSIKGNRDAIRMIGKTLGEMGGYILVVFVSAQFLNLFTKSNLGIIMAVKGANGIESLGLKGIPLIILYVLLVAFINLFIGSASAKWAILSPVFVPMFMILGYEVPLTQMAYRIGDASTNILSPLFPYLPLVLAVAKKYDKKFGLGTLIANMFPYSAFILSGSLILLVIFMKLGLPFGL